MVFTIHVYCAIWGDLDFNRSIYKPHKQTIIKLLSGDKPVFRVNWTSYHVNRPF